jgi:hypothetical protein
MRKLQVEWEDLMEEVEDLMMMETGPVSSNKTITSGGNYMDS